MREGNKLFNQVSEQSIVYFNFMNAGGPALV